MKSPGSYSPGDAFSLGPNRTAMRAPDGSMATGRNSGARLFFLIRIAVASRP